MESIAEFRQRMEAEFQRWESDLERWHGSEESAQGDPQRRREQQQMLDDLHEKRLQARQYLDQFARGDDQAALQPKMETLWTEIRREIAAIKQWA
jgi:hypothetical protein